MIVDVVDYFAQDFGRCARFATADCSTRLWLPGLLALRRILLHAGLLDSAKWGHPTFMHAGRNIAIIGAFCGDFRLSFFKASPLKDPERVLERQGPNTWQPDCLRFTDNPAPAALELVIRAYVAEAMGYAEAGILPAKEAKEHELPAELV
jgi:uncharacterized protein YdeI (YjbR/CyaY-like superfamily)